MPSVGDEAADREDEGRCTKTTPTGTSPSCMALRPSSSASFMNATSSGVNGGGGGTPFASGGCGACPGGAVVVAMALWWLWVGCRQKVCEKGWGGEVTLVDERLIIQPNFGSAPLERPTNPGAIFASSCHSRHPYPHDDRPLPHVQLALQPHLARIAFYADLSLLLAPPTAHPTPHRATGCLERVAPRPRPTSTPPGHATTLQ